MNTLSFLRLVQNAALLLSLVLIFDVFALRWRAGQELFSRHRLLAGVLIGIAGIAVMLTPWVLLPGLVFDTRTVLLSMAGLFFGPVPTIIAMLITVTLRLYQGGAGVAPGVSTIIVTGILGLVWRRVRRGALDEISLSELYLFGLATHLVMLALMFTLPWETALHTLRNISAPVLAIYPLASVLLGGLMANRLKREKIIDARKRAEEDLRAERQLLRTLIDNLPDAVYAKDAQGRKTLLNRADLDNIGLREEEVLGKTDAELFPPEISAGFMADDATVLCTGVPVVNREEFLVNAHGKQLWQLTSKLPLHDADGQIVGLVGIGRNITERKHTEEALRESEQKYRMLFEQLTEGFALHEIITDDQGTPCDYRFLEVNPAFEQATGYTRADCLGKTLREVLPNVTPDWLAYYEKVALTGEPTYMEEYVPVEGRHFAVWAYCPYPGQIAALIQDISARRQQEIERVVLLDAEHEQRLRAETLSDVTLALASALDSSDVLMEILHQAQRLVPSDASNIALVEHDTTRTVLRIVGWRGYAKYGDEQELAGMLQPLSDFAISTDLIATGQPYITADTYEDPHWQRLPGTAWVRAHISLPIQLGERILGILRLDSEQVGAFTMQDVERLHPLAHAAAIALENAQLYTQAQQELEERKRSQADLEASERKFRDMLENVRLFAVMMDLEGHITFCNDFGLNLLGVERSEALGRNWIETFILPEMRPDMQRTFAQHFATGDFPAHYENEILTADGTGHVLIAWNNIVIRDSEGVITSIAAVGEDITARRQAERALRASEAWLRSLVDSMDDVIFSLDAEQRYTAVYGRWMDPLELREEHFLGHTAGEVFGAEATRDHEAANVQVLTTGVSATYEWAVYGHHYQTTISPLRGPENEVVGLVGVGRDITALKTYQEQLQTTLDEKTLMLSEIHHRIKNNLQVILGLLNLQFGAVADEGAQQMLRESQNRIKAIALIHERLYQTPGESQINARLYLQSLVRYLTETYDALVRGIVVEQSIADLELNIDLAIPCSLIINELISNTLKYAFPPEWQSPDGAPPTLRIALRRTNGHARLEVADNGVGLPDGMAVETSPHLGLRLIQMLARQIDGELSIEQNAGTCIAVTFAWNEEQ